MKTPTTSIITLTLAATLALTGCASNDSGPAPGTDHGEHDVSTSVEANDADMMFVQMMIPHHQQAVEMVDALLDKEGLDPELITFAEQIKAAQQPEIDLMQGWLEDWGADPAPAGHEAGHGDGMMTEADVRQLEDATGAQAEELFLEQMITHHEGAIDMAQDEVKAGESAEAIALAKSVIENQTAEIATMNQILSDM